MRVFELTGARTVWVVGLSHQISTLQTSERLFLSRNSKYTITKPGGNVSLYEV
jgi:hypothetical protein